MVFISFPAFPDLGNISTFRAGIKEIVTQWVRIEVVIAAWKAVGLGV